MNKKTYILILFLSCAFFSSFSQNKKDPPKTRILFIFDASRSMLGQWESDKKINVAKRYLIDIIDSLENYENVQLALRIYGHQKSVPPQDCSDTRLEVPFRNGNAGEIRQKLRHLIPKGTTPIANSLFLAKKDFTPCTDCRNIIILITDGIEACDGDPCKAALELQKGGIALRPFVIGIGIDPNFEKTFECVGNYYNSPNEEKFEEVLGIVISRALNATTAQVNLLDKYGMPTETNVGMTFYDHISGQAKYNYVHTINYKGFPDTLILDPLLLYDLVVHTIPPVRLDSIKLVHGKHTMIGVDAPQGYLKVTCAGTNQYRDLKFIIRKRGEKKTIYLQQLNIQEKILTGLYDIEVLTLPRVEINNIEIKQNELTKIEIPRPGIANILPGAPGFGAIYKNEPGKVELIYTINQVGNRESLVMQPGNYKIIYRSKNSQKVINSRVKNFTIKSGSSNTIIIQ